MDNLESIVQELKDVIHESEYTTLYKPMGEELFDKVKTDLQSFLYRSGYTDNDIDVVVGAHEDDPNIVKIVLGDKSDKGKEFLDYILNQS